MTELQAWQYLALCWEEPMEIPYSTDWGAVVAGVECKGLCHSISRLFIAKRISQSVWCKMDYRSGLNRGGWYRWPLTRIGAKRRAEFCRRMLEEIRLERVKLKCRETTGRSSPSSSTRAKRSSRQRSMTRGT